MKTLTLIAVAVLFWPVPLFLWYRAAYTHGSLFAKNIHLRKVKDAEQPPPPRITLTKKRDDVVDVFRDIFL